MRPFSALNFYFYFIHFCTFCWKDIWEKLSTELIDRVVSVKYKFKVSSSSSWIWIDRPNRPVLFNNCFYLPCYYQMTEHEKTTRKKNSCKVLFETIMFCCCFYFYFYLSSCHHILYFGENSNLIVFLFINEKWFRFIISRKY